MLGTIATGIGNLHIGLFEELISVVDWSSAPQVCRLSVTRIVFEQYKYIAALHFWQHQQSVAGD